MAEDRVETDAEFDALADRVAERLRAAMPKKPAGESGRAEAERRFGNRDTLR